MSALPVFAAILGAAAIVTAISVVKLKDLVYASSMLAVLGSVTAAVLALMGFGIVSAFLVLIYVGAAVMFIIITISMLGLRGGERTSAWNGIIVALLTLVFWYIVVAATGLYGLYSAPHPVGIAAAAGGLLSHYELVVALLLVAQAATLVEAISIARRRSEGN